MNTKIKEILEQGQVDGFFAYKTVEGFPFPALFTRADTDRLEPWRPTEARYPITKLLLAEARRHPEKTYGVLVRGCEERSLNELFKWHQLHRERVVVVGQACSKELAEYCECRQPYPEALHYGERATPVEASRRLERLAAMNGGDRLNWWLSHFNRCIKCFGCRDVCPVCWCTECSLEHQSLIPAGKLPPDTSFHLVRAVHMAGRCVDCGLCEEVCPARIPLRTLYKEVNELVGEIFDYRPGEADGSSPFNFLGDETLLPPGPR